MSGACGISLGKCSRLVPGFKLEEISLALCRHPSHLGRIVILHQLQSRHATIKILTGEPMAL